MCVFTQYAYTYYHIHIKGISTRYTFETEWRMRMRNEKMYRKYYWHPEHGKCLARVTDWPFAVNVRCSPCILVFLPQNLFGVHLSIQFFSLLLLLSVCTMCVCIVNEWRMNDVEMYENRKPNRHTTFTLAWKFFGFSFFLSASLSRSIRFSSFVSIHSFRRLFFHSSLFGAHFYLLNTHSLFLLYIFVTQLVKKQTPANARTSSIYNKHEKNK